LHVVISFSGLLVPLSFGFAMLRYRLWDIDVLIRRTLVYGVLTLTLAGVSVGLVLGLSALTRTIMGQAREEPVALVISTRVAFFIPQPLRKPIQALIDRPFYRRKYDAAKTLQAFGAQHGGEFDLRQVSERLLSVVQETMQPASASLWLSQPPQKN